MRQLFSEANQEEEENEINITPMLDVVFIMLIFFIVTSSFIKEAGIDVNKPDAQTAVSQDKANILIAITERGEIWIDRHLVDPRAVRAIVELMHAENPQGTVVSQAAKKSTTEVLIQRLDAARLAGVGNAARTAEHWSGDA